MIYKKLSLLALFFCLLASNPAFSKKPEVNEKLKDECSYFKDQIERAVAYVASQDRGPSIGKTFNALALPSLVKMYKELCD